MSVIKHIDDTLHVENVSCIELARQHGTPLYVYDCDKIISQYNHLLDAFSKVKVKINYACKALTNINILKVLNKLGSGLDTVSIQEVEIGLKAGFLPENINNSICSSCFNGAWNCKDFVCNQ